MKEYGWVNPIIKVVGALLTFSLPLSAIAEEKLKIQENTPNSFSGVYIADKETISFRSVVTDDSRVDVEFDINGQSHSAKVSMKEQQVQLSDKAASLTAQEQELMFDASNALAEYVGQRQENLRDPMVVAVSALGYLSNRVSSQVPLTASR